MQVILITDLTIISIPEKSPKFLYLWERVPILPGEGTCVHLLWPLITGACGKMQRENNPLVQSSIQANRITRAALANTTRFES